MDKRADRETTVLSKESNRITKILKDKVLPTFNNERNDDANRPTAIMQNTAKSVDASGNRNTIQSASLLSEGEVIGGDYSVIKTMTENTGEATLLLAENNQSKEKAVLKIYHKDIKPKEDLKKALQQVSNKHVVKVIDEGIWNERYYEIMPYYQMGDIGSSAPIEPEKLIKVVIPGINDGLHALHSLRIVHRDIKPSNVFYTDDENDIVIGDFGISSVLNTDMSVRATGMARTLGYAAPETSTGYVSQESDYYSFGITLLHLVLGKDPFEGMSDMQILFQTVNEELNIPATVNLKIRTLILGLTIKDRNLRWGYKEVEDWLHDRAPSLPNNGNERKTLSGSSAKPYRFANHYYGSLPELERAFARDWPNAKKHLYRGLVEKHLALYGEDLVSDCMDLRMLNNKDAAVFKLLYLLDPNAPLNYQGVEYGTVNNLGKYMLNGFPSSIEVVGEMIYNGCLRYYLELHQQITPDLSQTLSRFEQAGKISREDFLFVAFVINGMSEYRINNNSFQTLDELAEFITGLSREERNNVCDLLMKDEAFPAWVRSLGFERQVFEWRKLLNTAGWKT